MDAQETQAHPTLDKKRRKEEGKRLKRQRIDDAGGTRPRVEEVAKVMLERNNEPKSHGGAKKSSGPSFKKRNKVQPSSSSPLSTSRTTSHNQHRFGGVMDQVPCRNRPRFTTVSIAVPGSVVANGQTRELRTHMVGQIARAATIYHVDEIIVYDDKLIRKFDHRSHAGSRGPRPEHRGSRPQSGSTDVQDLKSEQLQQGTETGNDGDKHDKNADPSSGDGASRSSNVHEFTARLLQFCECPQYLRRQFFPMHPDLQFAGLLAPVDAPHHVRTEDRCKYREGVVLDRTAPSGLSLVNCGIRSRPVE